MKYLLILVASSAICLSFLWVLWQSLPTKRKERMLKKRFEAVRGFCGKAIGYEMSKKRISPEELATFLERTVPSLRIDQVFLIVVEQGHVTPTFTEAKAIFDVLGCSASGFVKRMELIAFDRRRVEREQHDINREEELCRN